MKILLAVLCACALACGHAAKSPPGSTTGSPSSRRPVLPPPPEDPRDFAAELSEETHALLRTEGEMLWVRWTTGSGPLPASALADHPRLLQRDAVTAVASAAASARKPADELALRLLHAQLATWFIARDNAAETDALDRARAALTFAAPGDKRAERGERDLDRLLTDEPSAQKRAAIAQAEAKAAQALTRLALARDRSLTRALERAGIASWGDLIAEMHRASTADMAALAERTLAATESVARTAIAATAQRNLGVTIDRLKRADLPRMVRTAAADPQFPPGKGWTWTQATLTAAGADLSRVRIDADPSPSKAPRPLALFVDPPSDVRLSVRPTGGLDEQRALLREAARAAGAAVIDVPRWELGQLGAGSAAEGVAQLFEGLAGEPAWLREQTALRGEPLDDLVHTQATRRLLAARRAAAMVLFEIRRREGPASAESNAALYRALLQRATFATFSDDDAGRWPIEADGSLRAATQLQGAIFAAQLQQVLEKPPETPPVAAATPAAAPADPPKPADARWWHQPAAGPTLRRIWAQGRSGTAPDAARDVLGLNGLDPAVLASAVEKQLSYNAPEAPPPTQRPDYKYMQGDKRKKRRHKK